MLSPRFLENQNSILKCTVIIIISTILIDESSIIIFEFVHMPGCLYNMFLLVFIKPGVFASVYIVVKYKD